MKIHYIKCKICEENVDPRNWRHFKKHGFSTIKEYYDRYIKREGEGICPVCKHVTAFLGSTLGYQQFCSIKCSMLDPAAQEYRKKLYREKTGYDCPLSNPECREKGKITYKNKTGYEHSAQNPEVLKARDQHYFEKTGYKHQALNPEVKKKAKETYLARTGYESPFYNPNVISKIKKTMKERTGYESVFSNPAFREKIRNDYFIKTGLKSPMQNLETIIKAKRKYKYNNIFFDSSWEIAYYIWLSDNNIKFTYHKDFLEYEFNSEKHRYFPDFKVNGEYVEIKGPHLMRELTEANDDKNAAKYKCMLKYNVKIITNCDEYLQYVEEKYGKNYIKGFRYEKSKK